MKRSDSKLTSWDTLGISVDYSGKGHKNALRVNDCTYRILTELGARQYRIYADSASKELYIRHNNTHVYLATNVKNYVLNKIVFNDFANGRNVYRDSYRDY